MGCGLGSRVLPAEDGQWTHLPLDKFVGTQNKYRFFLSSCSDQLLPPRRRSRPGTSALVHISRKGCRLLILAAEVPCAENAFAIELWSYHHLYDDCRVVIRAMQAPEANLMAGRHRLSWRFCHSIALTSFVLNLVATTSQTVYLGAYIDCHL